MRRDTVTGRLCAISLVAGLAPLAWLDLTAVEARKADAARWAEDEKRKAWIVDCRKAIRDGKARVAAAKADLDRATDDLTNACTCLAEAVDPGANIFKDIFGHQVPKGESK